MLRILHTGQTGVERGVDRAARAMGITVRGFCPLDQRDELGRLPPHIAADLVDCRKRGYRTPWARTLELADATVIVVPKSTCISDNPGFDTLRDLVRQRGVPWFAADPGSDHDSLVTSLLAIPRHNPYLSLMVTGPRETRWNMGEPLGFSVVSALTALHRRRTHRVLVVDDSRESATRTAEATKSLGHKCMWTTSGQAALLLAQTLRPDVCIVSTGLIDVTGYELARQLRALDASPVFLVAAETSNDAGAAGRAYSAGFNHHVIKPLVPEMVTDVMVRATTWLPTTRSAVAT